MIENKNILQQFKEFMDKHKEFKYTESYIVRNNFKKQNMLKINLNTFLALMIVFLAATNSVNAQKNSSKEKQNTEII